MNLSTHAEPDFTSVNIEQNEIFMLPLGPLIHVNNALATSRL